MPTRVGRSGRVTVVVLSWLAGITSNVVSLWLRRSRSETRALEGVARESDIARETPPTPWDDLEKRETAETVWAAVDELPEHTREAVLLHYVGGLSDQEIGQTVGISASAVRSRLQYGQERLRERMLPVAERVFARQRRTIRFSKAVMAPIK